MRKVMYCKDCNGKICIPRIPVWGIYKCPRCGTKNDICSNPQVDKPKLLEQIEFVIVLVFYFGGRALKLDFLRRSIVTVVAAFLVATLLHVAVVAWYYPYDEDESNSTPSE